MVDSIFAASGRHLVLVAARELNPLGSSFRKQTSKGFLHAKCHVYSFVLAGSLNVLTSIGIVSAHVPIGLRAHISWQLLLRARPSA